jgi:hypothetical protein
VPHHLRCGHFPRPEHRPLQAERGLTLGWREGLSFPYRKQTAPSPFSDRLLVMRVETSAPIFLRFTFCDAFRSRGMSKRRPSVFRRPTGFFRRYWGPRSPWLIHFGRSSRSIRSRWLFCPWGQARCALKDRDRWISWSACRRAASLELTTLNRRLPTFHPKELSPTGLHNPWPRLSLAFNVQSRE